MGRTRIGEALVSRGLITEEQLGKALRWQVVVGVHLGTALIELGFAEESQVGKTLAEIQGVRYASREMFEAISQQAIDAIDADVVRQKFIIPIAMQERELHVAAIDAKNLSGLSVTTRCKIVPHVAPEYRIRLAMARYYGIATPVRLAAGSGVQRPRRTSVSGFAPIPVTAAPTPDRGGKSEAPAELAAMARTLSAVEDHAQLGEAILDFVCKRASRAILFDASGEGAKPVLWRGIAPLPPQLKDASVTATAESVLGIAANEPWYCGALPEDFDRAFYRATGLSLPAEILVLPIYGDERLEAVLYADAGPEGKIAQPAVVWNALADHVALAMGMLAFKRRLRSEREPSCV